VPSWRHVNSKTNRLWWQCTRISMQQQHQSTATTSNLWPRSVSYLQYVDIRVAYWNIWMDNTNPITDTDNNLSLCHHSQNDTVVHSPARTVDTTRHLQTFGVSRNDGTDHQIRLVCLAMTYAFRVIWLLSTIILAEWGNYVLRLKHLIYRDENYYRIPCCCILEWNLVCHIKGRTITAGVWE
jgi:hypothetical protein